MGIVWDQHRDGSMSCEAGFVLVPLVDGEYAVEEATDSDCKIIYNGPLQDCIAYCNEAAGHSPSASGRD